MHQLRWQERLAYGMGGLTISLSDMVVMQWLLVRYTPPDRPSLVPPALLGALVLLGRMAEGIGFAVVAYWSDQHRSRWGRRLPFMRFAILPFALTFFLVFIPPVDRMHWLNGVHASVMILAYFSLYGFVVVPYLALLPELASDTRERLNLTTWQTIFILVSTVLFGITGILFKHLGWVVVAGGIALTAVAFFLPACLLIRESDFSMPPEEERLGLCKSIMQALNTVPFRYALVSIGAFWFALNGLMALIPYWVVNVLGRSEDDVAKLMILYLAVSFVASITVNKLSMRFGKNYVLLATYLSGAVIFSSLSCVGLFPLGNEFTQTLVILALCGIPVAGFLVLPFAILADIVDHDERVTGRRREAIFYGVRAIFQKALIGISALVFMGVACLDSDGSRVLREDGWIVFSGHYLPVSNSNSHDPAEVPVQVESPSPRSIHVVVRPASLDAPWTLLGPEGFRLEGTRDTLVPDLTPGQYSISWHAVPGWRSPASQRTPTPKGLKAMAALCGLFSMIAFLAFLNYPLRDNATAVVPGQARLDHAANATTLLGPVSEN